MSTIRIITESNHPPEYPAIAPQATPMVIATNVAANPTAIEIRPPKRVRAAKSRPSVSVPNQWLEPGGVGPFRRS
ncbi:MAG: hypothetical protein BWY82_02760 [Verrucomicrobia bacterium ADurb.Bin474]|nr:MAG: hypothetical protein BWY82_02760 [Verrucomicrobia bacterium ADurb.Bin474]